MRLVRLISKAERSREIAIEASHAAIRRRLRLRLRSRRPHFPRHSRHRRRRRRSHAERRETRSCTLSSGRPRSQRSEIVFALRCRRLVTRSFSHLLLISPRMRLCRPLLSLLILYTPRGNGERLADFSKVFTVDWILSRIHGWLFVGKCAYLLIGIRSFSFSRRFLSFGENIYVNSRTYEKEKKFGYVRSDGSLWFNKRVRAKRFTRIVSKSLIWWRENKYWKGIRENRCVFMRW